MKQATVLRTQYLFYRREDRGAAPTGDADGLSVEESKKASYESQEKRCSSESAEAKRHAAWLCSVWYGVDRYYGRVVRIVIVNLAPKNTFHEEIGVWL